MPVYCASATASIALRAERFGYRVHGHDVVVRVCVEVGRIVDLVEYSRLVEDVVSRFDHRPLWEVLEIGDPLLEHLAAEALRGVVQRLGGDVDDAWCEVSVPEGTIIVSARDYDLLAGDGK